jgi:hypothetical protein
MTSFVTPTLSVEARARLVAPHAPPTPTLILKKRPFTRGEMSAGLERTPDVGSNWRVWPVWANCGQ